MYYKLALTIFTQVVVFYLLNKISLKYKFLDYPDGRKIHQKPVSYLGGINLLLTYLLIVFLNLNQTFLDIIIIFGSFVVLVGFIDDVITLKPLNKLILQSVIIFYFVNNYSFYLDDIGTYKIIGKLSLGYFGIVFTILCSLLIINAYNYCDGVDGLAIINYIFILTIFSILLHINNEYNLRNFLILLIIPSIIFLFFNFGIKSYKFFLGDSGSNYLGFLIAFIPIGMHIKVGIHPIYIIWPLSFLVYEFLSTNIIRYINKKNLVKPGNDHIHYEIQKLYKLNLINLNFIILIINIFLTSFGFLVAYTYSSLHSLVLFIIVFFIYLFFRINLNKKNIELS